MSTTIHSLAAVTQLPAIPAATERTRVRVPLRFADGYAVTAEVVTFHGLADGAEALGIDELDLLSNKRDKQRQLTDVGVTVRARTSTGVFASDRNLRYLNAKVEHPQHQIDLGAAGLVS